MLRVPEVDELRHSLLRRRNSLHHRVVTMVRTLGQDAS